MTFKKCCKKLCLFNDFRSQNHLKSCPFLREGRVFSRPCPKVDFWMHFGRPLAHFWLPFGSHWLPFGFRRLTFGSLWLIFGSLWFPFGSLLVSLGSLLVPFASLLLTRGSIFSLLLYPVLIFRFLGNFPRKYHAKSYF